VSFDGDRLGRRDSRLIGALLPLVRRLAITICVCAEMVSGESRANRPSSSVTTPLGMILQRFGAVRASPANARRVLDAGGQLLTTSPTRIAV
jgi:hypothetical protein